MNNEELIAPCGINCAFCRAHFKWIETEGKRGCAGCLPRNKQCAFLKKRCDLLMNKKVRFCYECKEFPCEDLSRIERNYKKRGYPNSFIDNQKFIQENGTKKFMIVQKRKFRCPNCKKVIAIHDEKCLSCGYKLICD